jgi:hypothetical protein
MIECCDLFRFDRSGMLPCSNKGFHKINSCDAFPIKKNPYKVPFALKSEMRKHLEMLQRGIITTACSERAAPVILVKKKSLDSTPKYRFVPTFEI